MTSQRAFVALIALIALLGVAIVAAAYGASGVLASHSAELGQLESTQKALSRKQTQLAKNKRDLARYRSLNHIATSVVPQDKNQAEAVREIVSLAKQSGIGKISGISFPSSNLGAGKNARAPTQVTPVQGIAGVVKLPITVTEAADSPVPYDNFIKFLTALEHNRRTSVISDITVQPDQKHPGHVSFTLQINEFIKPGEGS
jgi:hypothetical protein